MAQHIAVKPVLAGYILIMGSLMAMPSHAETLIDPTLPPSLAQTQVGTVPSGPVLQSVMLGARHKAALISGQLVPVGGKYGDAVLVRVSDHSAELRNPDMTMQILLMHPTIEKKVIVQKPMSKKISSKNKQAGVEQTPNAR
jgi:hypothetical protein